MITVLLLAASFRVRSLDPKRLPIGTQPVRHLAPMSPHGTVPSPTFQRRPPRPPRRPPTRRPPPSFLAFVGCEALPVTTHHIGYHSDFVISIKIPPPHPPHRVEGYSHALIRPSLVPSQNDRGGGVVKAMLRWGRFCLEVLPG